MTVKKTQLFFGLKKIYEKMNSLEEKISDNYKSVNEQSQRLDSFCEEMKKVTDLLSKGDACPHGETKQTKKREFDNSNAARNLRKIVNQRKLTYYNKVRSEGITAAYKDFLKLDPPFVPKKFREKMSYTESESQKSRIRKLEIFEMNCEIERLEEMVEKHRNELENAELEVKEQLSTIDDPSHRQYLKESWYSQIRDEKEKSNRIWESKKQFLDKLPQLKADDGKQRNDSHQRPTATRPYPFKRTNNFNRRPNNTAHSSFDYRSNQQNRYNGNFRQTFNFRHNR